MSIFERALHVPAERLFFEPGRARHERVLLPLAARPSPRFYGAIALSSLAAMASVCMGVELAEAHDSGLTPFVFAAVFWVGGLLPAGFALVGLRDALRPLPFLVIDGAGVRDTRLGPETIAWPDVLEAELVAAASGIQAVRLKLARDYPARCNPFRLGGWSASWATRRRSRLVAVALLDVRAHTLAHTMLLLAARHGAAVEQPSPFEIGPPSR